MHWWDANIVGHYFFWIVIRTFWASSFADNIWNRLTKSFNRSAFDSLNWLNFCSVLILSFSCEKTKFFRQMLKLWLTSKRKSVVVPWDFRRSSSDSIFEKYRGFNSTYTFNYFWSLRVRICRPCQTLYRSFYFIKMFFRFQIEDMVCLIVEYLVPL